MIAAVSTLTIVIVHTAVAVGHGIVKQRRSYGRSSPTRPSRFPPHATLHKHGSHALSTGATHLAEEGSNKGESPALCMDACSPPKGTCAPDMLASMLYRAHALPLPCHACFRYVFLTMPCARILAATTPFPAVPVPSSHHPQHPHPHVEPVGHPSFPVGKVRMAPAVLRDGPPLWTSPNLPAALGSCVRARWEMVILTSHTTNQVAWQVAHQVDFAT